MGLVGNGSDSIDILLSSKMVGIFRSNTYKFLAELSTLEYA